ncbi:hypothetical protein F2Q70_00041638 [Brassica cretica]|uniref:Uncharacterized protein n=1 Tax=Brassica cretica TaxID=69181 RepID=A0A8S9K755_BRACR|nr:hypothetical protein F2Q70_00041638 [Brassica cretica]
MKRKTYNFICILASALTLLINGSSAATSQNGNSPTSCNKTCGGVSIPFLLESAARIAISTTGTRLSATELASQVKVSKKNEPVEEEEMEKKEIKKKVAASSSVDTPNPTTTQNESVARR